MTGMKTDEVWSFDFVMFRMWFYFAVSNELWYDTLKNGRSYNLFRVGFLESDRNKNTFIGFTFLFFTFRATIIDNE